MVDSFNHDNNVQVSNDEQNTVNAIQVPGSSKVFLLPSSSEDDSEEFDVEGNVNNGVNYFHYFNIFT